MNGFPVIRWLLPLSGLLAGLVAGSALRPMAPLQKAAKPPAPPPVVKTAPPVLSEVIFEDLNMEKRRSLAERTRIEDAILKLTPAEALRRALVSPESYKGVYLFEPFAHELLWYRAASEDPALVWKEATAWVKRNSNEQRISLPGLFLAWVEKDPAAALAAAKASGDTWTIPPSAVDVCIAAWAARDAPACAQALEGTELKNTEPLFQNWVAKSPAAAMAWAGKNQGGLSTVYTSWAKADPLSAYRAALETALTAPPPPENSGRRGQASSCLAYSFYTFIDRFPELAVETACLDLPPLVRGQELDFVAQRLERAVAGGGEKFALSLPPGKPRAWSLGRVAGEVAERGDIVHAMALVESLTPEETWPAIDSTLVYLARTDPETGREWLLRMKPLLTNPGDWFYAADGFNSHLYQSRPSLTVDTGREQ